MLAWLLNLRGESVIYFCPPNIKEVLSYVEYCTRNSHWHYCWCVSCLIGWSVVLQSIYYVPCRLSLYFCCIAFNLLLFSSFESMVCQIPLDHCYIDIKCVIFVEFSHFFNCVKDKQHRYGWKLSENQSFLFWVHVSIGLLWQLFLK